MGGDSAVQWTQRAIQVREGVQKVELTIRRTGDLAGNCRVEYKTVAGSASEGKDFVATMGKAIFQPMMAETVVKIPILDDASDESDESFFVHLYEASNCRLGSVNVCEVTILDDDGDEASQARKRFLREQRETQRRREREARKVPGVPAGMHASRARRAQAKVNATMGGMALDPAAALETLRPLASRQAVLPQREPYCRQPTIARVRPEPELSASAAEHRRRREQRLHLVQPPPPLANFPRAWDPAALRAAHRAAAVTAARCPQKPAVVLRQSHSCPAVGPPRQYFQLPSVCHPAAGYHSVALLDERRTTAPRTAPTSLRTGRQMSSSSLLQYSTQTESTQRWITG